MSLADPDRLGPWLKAHLGIDGPIATRKIAGGQSNPTFVVEHPGGRLVLRRKPPGVLLKSAHAIEREYRVQRALTGRVPVARPLALCEDEDVLGAAFFVMEHVEGDTHDDPALPGLTPERRGAVYRGMAETLAAIHAVDLNAAGLSDFGPTGSYFDRQIGRWSKQYRASETERVEAMEALMARLAEAPPEDDGRVTLVHGDYRIDNLIWRGDAVAAVCDWELSTLGHPLADVAQLVMQWQAAAGAEGRGLAGVDRRAAGIPSDDAFVAMYAEAAGRAVPDLSRHIAFSAFRMAAILQGVKRRALDGNASDPERGLRLGRMVPELAALGLRYADRPGR